MSELMGQSIVDWKNWMLAAGLSQTTVTAYEWDVRALAKAYPEHGPFDVRAADLNRYQVERRLAEVGASARKRSVCACRSFFGYVCGKKSPAKALPIPKVERPETRVLNWDQAEAVLAACETTSARGLRDLALICLLIESGLRNAEVCRLELAKVDLVARRLRVIVKGGHWGKGSFDPVTADYLARWVGIRGEFARPETRTFFCAIGGTQPGASLTPEGLRSIFRKIGVRAGLADGFSPHDLRRSCATLKTRLGAPSRVVQVGGRWSNLREVETYTQEISLDDFERYSPISYLHQLRPAAPER